MKALLEQAESFSKNNEFLKWTILKEILHYDILEALYKSNISKELVFQGGTALRLCYKSARYSEDLDFVLKNGEKFSNELMDEFENVFVNNVKTKYNLQAVVSKKEKSNRIENVAVDKWTAKVIINHKEHIPQQKINIEIAAVPSHSNDFTIITNNYDISNNVNIGFYVETLEEILADKMIAISQRAYFKARDFWDVKWLADKGVQPNISLINKKINDYKITNFKEQLEKKVAELDSFESYILFKNEMGRFLNDELLHMVNNSEVVTAIFNKTKDFKEIIINEITTDIKPIRRLK